MCFFKGGHQETTIIGTVIAYTSCFCPLDSCKASINTVTELGLRARRRVGRDKHRGIEVSVRKRLSVYVGVIKEDRK